jgi:hypothetical protein
MTPKVLLLVAVLLVAGCGSPDPEGRGDRDPQGEAPDCRPGNVTSCVWPDWVRSLYETKGYWPVTNYTEHFISDVHAEDGRLCFQEGEWQHLGRGHQVRSDTLAAAVGDLPHGARILCDGDVVLWWVVPWNEGEQQPEEAWFTLWNPWDETLVNITGPRWGEHFVHDFQGDRVLFVVYEDGDVDTQLRVWNLKTRRVEHVLGPQHYIDDSSTTVLTDNGLVNFREPPGTQEYQLVLLAPDGKEAILASLERRPSQLREEDGTYYWVESDEDPPFRAQALMMLRDGQRETLYEKEALLKIEDTSGDYVVIEEKTRGNATAPDATCETTSVVHAPSKAIRIVDTMCHYDFEVVSSSLGPRLRHLGTRIDGNWLFTRVENQNYTGEWNDTNLFRHPNPLAAME